MRLLWCCLFVVDATKVMTWNLWNADVSGVDASWGERVPYIRDTVRLVGPDVLACQETTKVMIRDLGGLLVKYASRFHVGDNHTGEGLMVYSRHPIDFELRVGLPIGTADTNKRWLQIVETNGMRICNTHLSYDRADAYTQLQWILGYEVGGCDALVGDFNVYADDLRPELLWSRFGWVDTGAGVSTCCGASKTNPADRVLVRGERGLSGAFDTRGSDHSAVFADVFRY